MRNSSWRFSIPVRSLLAPKMEYLPAAVLVNASSSAMGSPNRKLDCPPAAARRNWASGACAASAPHNPAKTMENLTVRWTPRTTLLLLRSIGTSGTFTW